MPIEKTIAQEVREWAAALELTDQEAAEAIGSIGADFARFTSGNATPTLAELRMMELCTTLVMAVADLRSGQAHKARTALERVLTPALDRAARSVGPAPPEKSTY